MDWKYKIELENYNIFSEIEKKYDMVIPEEVRKFIIDYNAATPSQYKFMLVSSEKVLGAVLSFNVNDPDNVFTALSVIENNNLIPIAIDPFGNYICYDIKSKYIIFWDHETRKEINTEKKLSEFISKLY